MFDSLSLRVVASGAGAAVPAPPFKTMKMVV